MAAPGAEKAIITGTRSFIDGTIVSTAIPRHRADTQEAISAGLAPSAPAAENTRVIPLVNPTRVATKPAVRVDAEKSRSRRTGGA